MIYLFIFIYFLSLAVIYELGKVRFGRNVNKIIVFLVLVGLAGFRYRVGGDTFYYMIMFDYLPNLSELLSSKITIIKLQPLWIILTAISKSIHPEFYIFQIIHALFINSVIFYFINKYTTYFYTGILLYYIGFYGYFNFEILREAIAICFFLLSIESFLNKNWIKYYTLIIIAFGFHYSALILFIFPIIKKIPITFFSILVTLILGIILNTYFSFFISSINSIANFILFLKNYADYQYTIWGLISILFLYVLYPTILLILSRSFLKINKPLYPFLRLYIYLGAFTTLFFIFFRFLDYLTPIIFIFLTEIIHGFYRQKKTKAIAPVLVFVMFSLISFIHISRYFSDTSEKISSSRWYSRWYPYYSIFDEEKDVTREQLIRNF